MTQIDKWCIVCLVHEQAGQSRAMAIRGARKVRAPKSAVLGNSQAGQPDGKRNREQVVDWQLPVNKSETVA